MTTPFVIAIIAIAWALLSALVCLSVCMASAHFSARVERREFEAEANLTPEMYTSDAPRLNGARMETIARRAHAKGS